MKQKVLHFLRNTVPYFAVIPRLGQSVKQVGCEGSTGPTSTYFSDSICVANNLLDRGLTLTYFIITALAVIFLIISGIQYIQASGNDDQTKKARQRIINVIIAIILLTAAYFVLRLITVSGSTLAGWFKG